MLVAAVVLDPGSSGPALEALDGQDRRPDDVTVVDPSRAGRASAVGEALRAPGPASADWVWLLDAGVIPEAGALEALLAPLESLGSLTPPVLLAGRVLGRDGQLDASAAPWPRLTDKETAVEAVAHRLVSIRAARHGSLLVSRAAVGEHAPPRADYVTEGDDLEWTGRLLRGARGYLVPRSVAHRSDPGAGALRDGSERHYRDVRNRVDMLRRDVWDGDERLWFGLTLAQDVGRELCSPAARRTTLRAVRDGLARR